MTNRRLETGPDIVTEPYTIESRLNSSSPWTYHSSGDEPMQGFHHLTEGVDISRYHFRRKRGDLLPYTPFSQTRYSWKAVASSYAESNHPNGSGWRRVGPFAYCGNLMTEAELSSVVDAFIADIDTRPMVQAAAAKIYSKSGHDTLTFLAEARKTVRLFKGLLDRLYHLARLSDLAGAWLEYRYGWRILVLDMLELHQQVRTLSDDRQRYTDRVGSSEHHIISESCQYSDQSIVVDGNVVDIVRLSTRGMITADVDLPSFQFNPAVTAWELVKFTFIIDWFVQVGTFIESLSFLLLARDYSAAGGYSVSLERTITPVTTTWTPGYSGSVTTKGHTAYYEAVGRIPQRLPLRPFSRISLDTPKVADFWILLWKNKSVFNGVLRI